MNQPTREEFNELKEEVRQLKEQQTEEINVRVERRLSTPEANKLQKTFEEVARANTEIGLLKGQAGEVKAIVANIKATVSDQGDMLRKTVATKEDLTDLEAKMIREFAKSKNVQDVLNTKL